MDTSGFGLANSRWLEMKPWCVHLLANNNFKNVFQQIGKLFRMGSLCSLWGCWDDAIIIIVLSLIGYMYLYPGNQFYVLCTRWILPRTATSSAKTTRCVVHVVAFQEKVPNKQKLLTKRIYIIQEMRAADEKKKCWRHTNEIIYKNIINGPINNNEAIRMWINLSYNINEKSTF